MIWPRGKIRPNFIFRRLFVTKMNEVNEKPQNNQKQLYVKFEVTKQQHGMNCIAVNSESISDFLIEYRSVTSRKFYF